MALDTVNVAKMIQDWDPGLHEVHCSNCLHATVNGDPDKPVARCEAGYSHGVPIDLARLLRVKNPRGFAMASKCPSFRSMSD